MSYLEANWKLTGISKRNVQEFLHIFGRVSLKKTLFVCFPTWFKLMWTFWISSSDLQCTMQEMKNQCLGFWPHILLYASWFCLAILSSRWISGYEFHFFWRQMLQPPVITMQMCNKTTLATATSTYLKIDWLKDPLSFLLPYGRAGVF